MKAEFFQFCHCSLHSISPGLILVSGEDVSLLQFGGPGCAAAILEKNVFKEALLQEIGWCAIVLTQNLGSWVL